MLIMIIYSFYGNWGEFGECLEPSLSFLWLGAQQIFVGELSGGITNRLGHGDTANLPDFDPDSSFL